MAKIDLSKFKKPTQNFLKPEMREEEKISPVKEKKKKVEEKIGRPRSEKKGELLSKPVTINFTEEQLEKINGKRGMASAATYLRNVIREAGIID